MKKCFLSFIFYFLCSHLLAQPADYVWTEPSSDASESMPCGGGDVGMNVWVEQGDVLFYLSRSGAFDENNTLLKQGRFRLHLTPGLRLSTFRQVLHLAEGYVEVTDGQVSLLLWADVSKPVVHVEVAGRQASELTVTYESWRTEAHTLSSRERFQTSYKFAAPKGLATQPDSITAADGRLEFLHQNGAVTIFDATVSQQRMDAVKHRLANPIGRLVFGGVLTGTHLTFDGQEQGRYASTGFEGWRYASRKATRHHLQVVLASVQGTVGQWRAAADSISRSVRLTADRAASRQWWRSFWQRSFVALPAATAAGGGAPHADLVRNYTLFRYMLGCNARGVWPTKFNGGLFTFDPVFVNPSADYQLSPDFRNWGGGVHTAQNQRLVYWPMLKSGDYDLLLPQLEFYLNIYKNAEERSRLYWGHEGACLTEQVENYGLPCFPEYGTKRPEGFDPGLERNAWLEYEWDTCLEFCQMALDAHRYGGIDIARYVPLVASCLRFFDEHYQYLASQRGAKRLDGNGKLVLYPGSGGETFKGAYNSTSTVAALRTVTQALMDYEQAQGDTAALSRHASLLARLPDITLRDSMIAPALHYERVQNVESTQLYPVFPWRIYGMGRPGLEVARNTYWNDSLAVKFRSHVGWKQDAIWAACLGLTDEASRLVALKLANGPHRFPAFWGPGFDWTPDHNWGGSGMIALQEMLLQETPDGHLLLFPAWPRQWDIRFRLHASGQTVVEAELRQGRLVHVSVTPRDRTYDVCL